MADDESMTRCEQNITDFYIEFKSATAFVQKGIDLRDFSIQREGIFRVADSWMRITNMTWQCYQIEKVAEYTLETVVRGNLNNPLVILANCVGESFYITSALVAQFANWNYEDWFSFSYYMGDLFYRMFVIDRSYFFE